MDVGGLVTTFEEYTFKLRSFPSLMQVLGKGAALERIARQLPEVPIPPFIRVRPEVLWKPWFLLGKEVPDKHGIAIRRLARSIGYPLIVRSDAAFEDGLGKSFAGLCRSRPVRYADELEHALAEARLGGRTIEEQDRSWRRIEAYAAARGQAVQRAPIDVIFQRYVPSRTRAVITEHPNVPEAYFVDIETDPRDGGCPVREGYLFRRRSELSEVFGESWLGRDLRRALDDCDRVKRLFPENVSYQAEVTLCDYAFVQWRPFRKKEYASFSLDAVAPSAGSCSYDVAIVLGVTDEAGIVCEPVNWRVGGRISQSFARTVVSGAPDVSFFFLKDDGQTSKYACAAWQSHDLFRFMELGTHVGFGLLQDGREILPEAVYGDGERMRYWSNGRRGRIRLLE